MATESEPARMSDRDASSGCQDDSADRSLQEWMASYINSDVHELMLRDRPRTLAYRDFFAKNPSVVKDKVVLDVGAGTGILSLFAASHGARKVYAVEGSEVAKVCSEIIKANGFEGVVEVIHKPIEEVELPCKVDVIISEWMGFYLLHEAMLESVLLARDRWLKEDGVMAPYWAKLYMAPVSMEAYLEEKVEYWHNVYGFDFSPMVPLARSRLLQEPVITSVTPEQLLGPPVCITSLNLRTVTAEAVREVCEWIKLSIDRAGELHGYAVWFDVIFRPRTHQAFLEGADLAQAAAAEDGDSGLSKVGSLAEDGEDESPEGMPVTETSVSALSRSNSGKESGAGREGNSSNNAVPAATKEAPKSRTFSVPGELVVTLSTGPSAPETHWKQAVLMLPATVPVEQGDVLCCVVSLKQDPENRRHYVITVDTEAEGDGSIEEREEEEEEEDDYDTTDHPVPCDCGGSKCRLIQAIVAQYDREQQALEDEAETVDVRAEVEAAAAMDAEGLSMEEVNSSAE